VKSICLDCPRETVLFAELYLTDRDYDLRLSMTTLRHKGSGAHPTAFDFANRQTRWLCHCRQTCPLAVDGRRVVLGDRITLLEERTAVRRHRVRTCRRCRDFR